jgi:hypothetical protein
LQGPDDEWAERCQELELSLKQRDQQVFALTRDLEESKNFIIKLREDRWEMEEQLKTARDTIARLEKRII